MNEKTIKTLRHIITARIDHASDQSAYIAWCTARDIVEYALAENTECLNQFDYLLTKEDCEID